MSAQVFKVRIDGSGEEYPCDHDDTILRAGLRAGLGLPYDCNVGGCGSCKISVLDGEFDVLWADAPGLSPRDRKRGKVLACQCRPKSELTIEARLGQPAEPQIKPEKIGVRLQAKELVTHDMMRFDFSSESAAQFKPGQYALLSLANRIPPRAYSMSNLANEQGMWSFIIRRVPDGKATGILFDNMDIGATATLDGPYGNAYLRLNDQRDIVCIAGGSGLAPIVSIMNGACEDQKRLGMIKLFYGARTEKDVFAPSLLSFQDDANIGIEQNVALSDETVVGDGMFHGMVHQHVAKVLEGQMSDYTFYVAGPPPMTEAVTRLLVMENSVDFDQVHYDRFF